MPLCLCHRRLLAALLSFVALAVCLPAGAQELKFSTSQLSFIAVVGTSPGPQQFTAYPEPATGNFYPVVVASTQSGNWLAVSTSAGGSFVNSVTVLVSVNSSTLPVGDYTGQLSVTASGFSGSPASVGVSLKVVPAAPYLAVGPASLAIAAKTGVDPAPSGLTISNAGVGTISPSLSVATSGGGDWLSVTQSAGNTLGSSVSFRVQVHSSTLAAGTYNGTITVTSPGATNSPLNVPVALTVGASGGPVISPAPQSLSFVAGLGANPRPQSLQINNTGTGTLRPSLAVATANGGGWLLLSKPIGGSYESSEVVYVSADIAGLAKATYSGTISISDPSAEHSPVAVPVTLLVEDAKPVMRLSSSWIAFQVPAGPYQPRDLLYIDNLGTGLLKWTAAVTTENNKPWLSIQDTTGELAYTFTTTIIADATGLPAGIYNGKITLSSNATSGDNPQTVKVTLAVGLPLPTVLEGGIVNAASFASTTVAPGEIVAVFGSKMGPTTGVEAKSFVAGKLPTDLAGVQVLFNGVPAPLYYVSAGQVNVQLPFELTPSGSVTVQVVYNGVPSPEFTLNLRPTDPGVFLVGGKPGVFFNGTATQVTTDTPAKAGEGLVIYATGLGAVDLAGMTGTPAPLDRLVRTTQVTRVTMGGVAVPVLFSGLVPTLVGLYQVNIQVPDTLPSGNTSMILSVGTKETAPMAVPIR